MFESDQYEIIDFGGGEKLEKFGGMNVRRETPSVDLNTRKSNTADWDCEVSFARGLERGKWIGNSPDNWSVRHGNKQFLLRQTPAGQVGCVS